MKKPLSALMIFVLIILFGFSSFAEDEALDFSVKADTSAMPQETAYIDVLMPKEAFGDNFCEFNEGISVMSAYRYVAGLSREPYEELEIVLNSEISRYNTDGYFSFLSHYKAASGEFSTDLFNSYHDYYYGSQTEADCKAVFFLTDELQDVTDTKAIFQSARRIKLAYVDSYGNILMITDPISVKDRIIIGRRLESVRLTGNKVTVKYSVMPAAVLIYVVIIAAAVTAFAVVRRKRKKPEIDTKEQGEGE